jgi:hypothetical protein
MKRLTWIAYLLCLTAMVMLFRFGSRSEDAGIVVFLIVLVTFALGSLSPRRAWQWALLVGLSVPFAYLLSGFQVAPVGEIPGLLVLTAFLVGLGLAGSYSGTLVRRYAQAAFKARTARA